MSLESALDLARQGRLYPAVILHGGTRDARIDAGILLARILLCAGLPAERPCGACRHCRRIGAEGPEGADGADRLGRRDSKFHPDFRLLERDLRTSTSVEATKEMLRLAQVSPFEGRGQVFLILDADSLTGGAANALLKTLEEPPTSAPRHFLLLAPAASDLLPTLRSRSLAIYLGTSDPLASAAVEEMARALSQSVGRLAETGSPLYLLDTAAALGAEGGFEDPRSALPWSLAARALVELAKGSETPSRMRPHLLALAGDLLRAPDLRLRGIPAQRILEGLVSRHLAGI